jgi:alpha-ketoglutarate-dependent taurine dioxygenase
MGDELLSREKLKTARRRPVGPEGLVRAARLQPDRRLPLVIEAAVGGLDAAAWAAANRGMIEARLLEHGGLLFRGFDVGTPEQFAEFMRAVSPELLEYGERSSPRTRVAEHVYTSTDYPAAHPIFVHNENSYQRTWPMKVFFFCETPAESGGETPVADCRGVYARLAPHVRARFVELGWMYVRNFGDGLGLPWRTVFQTDDRRAVEEHCRRNHIEAEWKDGDRLRLRAVRRAVARHPQTGEEVWFNHATFFHISTLEPEVRRALSEEFAEDDLPTNSFYGDGSPIEAEVLEALREAYRLETVTFAWQRGDILLLDNMLAAHGRAPYTGRRKILVGMSEPFGEGVPARRDRGVESEDA